MDYAISWDGEPEDVCLTASGVADLGTMDAMLTEAVGDPRWRANMRLLFDYSRLDMSGLNTDAMQARADQIKDRMKAFGPQRVAVVPSETDSHRKIRLIGMLLDGNVGFHGHVFDSLPEARDWLRGVVQVALPHVTARPT
jgi:hypothetical protein